LAFPEVVVLDNELAKSRVASERLKNLLKSLGRYVVTLDLQNFDFTMVCDELCHLLRPFVSYKAIVENHFRTVSKILELGCKRHKFKKKNK
jgi:hypothetical protein